MARDLQKKEYATFITEKTPWFCFDFILCMCYLPNIN